MQSKISSAKLFVILFVLFSALLASSVLQAWSGPSTAPPGGNVAAPVHVGATDQIKNGGLGLNALAVYGSQYVQTKLGIGRVSPVVALDVNGTLRLADGGEVCQAVTEGSQRYNSTTKQMEFCDGESWKVLGSGAAAPDPQVFTFTSSGTWTKPSGNYSTATLECWGGGRGGQAGQYITGGSAYTLANPGSGGEGGAYSRAVFAFSQLPASISVTVGGGGAGGSSMSSFGAAGGSSSIGSYVVAPGGGSGTSGVAVVEYGAGGGAHGEEWTGSGYAFTGNPNGGSTTCAGAGGGAGGGTSAYNQNVAPGQGGTSGCGGNGGAGAPVGGSAVAGTNYGGGGGGGYSGYGGGWSVGRAGAPGKCVITAS